MLHTKELVDLRAAAKQQQLGMNRYRSTCTSIRLKVFAVGDVLGVTFGLLCLGHIRGSQMTASFIIPPNDIPAHHEKLHLQQRTL